MNDFDDLGFEPVHSFDETDTDPKAGVAEFRGVPYSFQRLPDEEQTGYPGDIRFELQALDSSMGLKMLAIGEFQEVGFSESTTRSGTGVKYLVRWTSLGSPELIGETDPVFNLRYRFCDFLRLLIDGTATRALWDAYMYTQYPDDLIEEVRISCLQLLGNNGANEKLTTPERRYLLTLQRKMIGGLGHYNPVYVVEEMDEHPISGLATCFGVLCKFSRLPKEEQINVPGYVRYELRPFDSTKGVNMVASGKFREQTEQRSIFASASNFEVRWDSFFSPELIQSPNVPKRFAEFLRCLADGKATFAYYSAFSMTFEPRYEAVGEIRRKLVDLFHQRGNFDPLSKAEAELILKWADQILDNST